MKKKRGDEPIHVIMHIYMETLCVAILNKQKLDFFLFILLQNRRTGGWNRSC
jgi:hypothetical protein